jgi:DNA-binding transcriptional regulator YiaG
MTSIHFALKFLEESLLSVYKWESGKVQPRAAQLAKIAAIQKIGKREAASRLVR